MCGREDADGLWAMLCATIFLVMAAIAVSVAIENEMGAFQSGGDMEHVDAFEAHRVAALRARVRETRAGWRALESAAAARAEEIRAWRAATAALRDRRRALETERAELEAERAALAESVTTHLKTFRDRRSALIGRRVERFESRSGRVYRDVVIRGFGERSMSIAHADGLARVPFVDCSDEWRGRIAWGADELPAGR
jgi:hypothetical protein